MLSDRLNRKIHRLFGRKYIVNISGSGIIADLSGDAVHLGIEAVRVYAHGAAAFVVCPVAYGVSGVVVPCSLFNVIMADRYAVAVGFFGAVKAKAAEQLILGRGRIVGSAEGNAVHAAGSFGFGKISRESDARLRFEESCLYADLDAELETVRGSLLCRGAVTEFYFRTNQAHIFVVFHGGR